jgi:DNA replication protein DnaC
MELDCWHPKLKELAAAAEKFCGRWFRRETARPLLVLVGKPGCGKTHVAVRVARFAMAAAGLAYEKGAGRTWRDSVPCVMSKSWPEVADRFGRYGESAELDDMKAADLLVLDDIGAEDDSFKKASNKLCQLLSVREKKFTVVTTNVQPANWGKVFDVRIADRLLRRSTVVDLTEVDSYATK